MRKILYKGKRIDNGEWVEGSLIKMDSNDNCQMFIFPFHEGASTLSCARLVSFGMTCIIPETVSQFTGLTDKFGKKIFEGDIVLYKKTKRGHVIFLQQEMGYVIVFEKSDIRMGHRSMGGGYDFTEDIEVVGNIFDNPEIIERG